MTTINQSSGSGALFELVARGNKDHYFVRDSPDSYFPFNAQYDSSIHHLAERKTTVPLNGSKFGGTFEVELDPFADVLTECALEVDLPTWIPPLPVNLGEQPTSPDRVNRLYWIKSGDSGISYGYVNYIGYLLFEKIQFYQDQILLQEWSGDGLLAKAFTEGSWNLAYLSQEIGGGTSPGERFTALRATPGHIRIKLPLPGLGYKDGGFPLIGMQNQTFRFRVKLRALEDLIVCSDDSVIQPSPFSKQFQYTDDLGNLIQFDAISLLDMKQPTILLSTIQHYVPPVVQHELKMTKILIPFRRIFENVFTFGELDYKPLDHGGVANVTRRLDGRHPTERLFWFSRTHNSIAKNRLDDFFNPLGTEGGSFYNQIKLIIAGRYREEELEPYVWELITPYAKDERYSGQGIGTMRWSLDDPFGTVYPRARQPEGTVNFTTADRPTLHISLQNIPYSIINMQRISEMKLFTEGWAVYEIFEGRGRMVFAN